MSGTIGAAFDLSVLASIEVPDETARAGYLLPRAWMMRTFVILGASAYLGTWRSYLGHRDAGQRVVYYTLLPVLALVLPVLPLLDRAALEPDFALFGLIASTSAFIVFLRSIGTDRFVRGVTHDRDPTSRFLLPVRGKRRRWHLVPTDIAYAVVVTVVAWGYTRYF